MEFSSGDTGRTSSTRTRQAPATYTSSRLAVTPSRGVKRRASFRTKPIKRRRTDVPKFPGLTISSDSAKPSQAESKQSGNDEALLSDSSDLSDIETTPEPPDSLERSLREIASRSRQKEGSVSREDSVVETGEELLQHGTGASEGGRMVEESDDAGSTIDVAPWKRPFPVDNKQEGVQPQPQNSEQLQPQPENVPEKATIENSTSRCSEFQPVDSAIEMTTEQLEQFQEYAPDGLRRSRRPSRLTGNAASEATETFDAGDDELANSPGTVSEDIKKRVPKKESPGKCKPTTPRGCQNSKKRRQASTKAKMIVTLKTKFTPLPASDPQVEPSIPLEQKQQTPQKSPTDLSIFKFQSSSTAKRHPTPRTPVKEPLLAKASPLSASENATEEEVLLQDVSPELIALAKHLIHREPLGSKPEPASKPLVWADTRQALTETLSYFKRPQGGCYSKDGHIYGFLFDGVSHSREYISADVVISRQGGGMGPDGKTFAQAKDHHISDTQATAFRNNIANQNPIVLIVGRRNTAVHIAVPHTFCVLDFYKPIAVWTEKTQGAGKRVRNTVKYRFERLRGDGADPWHAAKDVSEKFDYEIAGPLSQASCIACHCACPQIYLCGWMCVNGDCTKFWKLSDGQNAPTGTMLYNPAFLLDRTPWPKELPSWPLRPALPDFGKTIGDNLLYVNSRGLCCPRCGRCTQRYKFSRWVCDNTECDYPGVSPYWSVLEAPQLHRPWDLVSDGIPHTRNKHRADRGVTLSIEYSGDWKISRYHFDGVNGQLLHVSPTRRINAMPKGADDMLAELQRASFDNTNSFNLERRRFKGNKGGGKTTEQKTPQKSASKKSPQTVKSNHNETEEDCTEPDATDEDDQVEVEDGDFMGAFSINYGWPYKFIATGASESFDGAPDAVRASRSMLQWAATEFLGPAADGHDDFNEQLIFTYMQDQKLGYHDDGEYGLGPRIGTMTLGGPAQMNIRLKMKYFAGCSKETKIFTYERPLPKCYYAHDKYKSGWYQNSYEQRVVGFEELELLRSTDPQKFKVRSKEIPQEIGMHPHCRRHADDSVNLTLRHGDMIFMEGYDIQKYFEHGVQAEGFLRYALTCRKVLPGHLELRDYPKYEVRPDDYGYVGPIFDD